MLVLAVCKERRFEALVDVHCAKSELLVSFGDELGNYAERWALSVSLLLMFWVSHQGGCVWGLLPVSLQLTVHL